MRPPEIDDAFSDIVLGEKWAAGYCAAVYDFLHLLDDLADKDNTYSALEASLTVLHFYNTLAFNKFFQKHKADLSISFQLAIFAWLASERLMQKDDLKSKMAGEVIKSQYQDIFFRVAYLIGGAEHAINMDAKYRGYVFG